MAAVTPGRLTAVWLVLRTVEKLGGRCSTSTALSYARRSGLRGGGLPIRDGLALGLRGGFLSEEGNDVQVGALGQRALQLGTEDDPSVAAIRLLASVLFLAVPPTWVAWWQGSPDDLERVIPKSERKVLSDAELLPGDDSSDLSTWAWWDALRQVPAASHDDAARKALGDAGEALSVDFERERLKAEGHPDLAERVTWVAQVSDAYGFDVLSFAGTDPELSPDEAIAIEVKSTALPSTQRFRFYLSSHEWQTAEKLTTRYRLHLWSGVDVGPPPASRQTHPVVLPAQALTGHLPVSPTCGDICTWQTAHLELPLTS